MNAIGQIRCGLRRFVAHELHELTRIEKKIRTECFWSAGRPRTAFHPTGPSIQKRHEDVSHSESFAKYSRNFSHSRSLRDLRR
jgi:hypothetical protein